MYRCTDCKELFDEPKVFTDTHGLDTPPYEESYVCPHCYGSFVETYECDRCGEYITENYVETIDLEKICDQCYSLKNIAENY